MNNLTSQNILKLSMFAGEIMLKNGAEVYRVEDTMKRILMHYDCEIAESFVTVTAIVATIEDKKDGIITMVKRVTSRTNNLEKIALVNQFSRDICNDKITFDDAFIKLDIINKTPPYHLITRMIAGGLTGFGFVFMFGGNFFDAFVTFIIGFIVYYIKSLFDLKKVSNMIVDLICGAIISFLAIIFVTTNIGTNLDTIIISSMMPYVPGLLLTNAIRDIFAEDFLSGSARLVNAILVSVSLATGVGTSLMIWITLFGGLTK